MTQLQPTAGHSTGAPASPGAHWDWRTVAIVVGAFALMAAAFGLAMWLDSDSSTIAETEVSTVAVDESQAELFAEIDARITAATSAATFEVDSAPSYGANAGFDSASFSGVAVDPTRSYGADGGFDAESFGG